MWSAVTGRPRSKVAETRSLGKPERGRELHFWRETSSGTKQLPSEQVDCAAALYDFLDAVRHNLEPGIFGRSALPTMQVLQSVQDAWDAKHGSLPVSGRRRDG